MIMLHKGDVNIVDMFRRRRSRGTTAYAQSFTPASTSYPSARSNVAWSVWGFLACESPGVALRFFCSSNQPLSEKGV